MSNFHIKNWAKDELNLKLSDSQINKFYEKKCLAKVLTYLASNVKNKQNYEKCIQHATASKLLDELDKNNNLFKQELDKNQSNNELQRSKLDVDFIENLYHFFMVLIQSDYCQNVVKFDENKLQIFNKLIDEFFNLIENFGPETYLQQSTEELNYRLKMVDISKMLDLNLSNMNERLSKIYDTLDEQKNSNLNSSNGVCHFELDNIMEQIETLNSLLISWTKSIQQLN